MVSDPLTYELKRQRLAELEEAERNAVTRWQNEINAAKQKRVYDYITGDRHVEYLVHFTPLPNIQSILKNGILSRDTMDTYGISAVTPDEYRYDYQTSYTSFSISFPNYQLFYNKRNNTRYDYAVLLIDPQIIKDTALERISYLPYNAASRNIGPVEMYTGLKKLKDLFVDPIRDGYYYSREELSIPPSYPTNPQAEVFIKAVVAPTYIRCIVVENEDIAKKLREDSTKWDSCNVPIMADYNYFRPRTDYLFWKTRSGEEV